MTEQEREQKIKKIISQLRKLSREDLDKLKDYLSELEQEKQHS